MNDYLSTTEINEILERRAKTIAREKKHDEPDQIYMRIAVLSLGGACLGIPLNKIHSITKTPPIAIMPQMPPTIRGLVQIRGELVGAIDLARWFEIPNCRHEYLVVVEELSGRLGLLVDKVIDFKDINYMNIAKGIDDDSIEKGHPVDSITKDFIVILDIKRLFKSSAVKCDFIKKQS